MSRFALADGNLFRTPGGAGDPDGVAVSGTAVSRSTAIRIEALSRVSVHAEWSGTPTGTFVLQVSNKAKPDDASDTGWLTWTPATAIVNPAGAPGATLLVFDDARGQSCPARWARVKYTNASGTGVLSGFVAGKA